MDEKVIYSCVDQEHNTWNCRGCGYIETFEADGPVENGWNFCPGCGPGPFFIAAFIRGKRLELLPRLRP